MSTYEFSVPCLFGLEGIAGDELRRLDIPNVRVENGRVLFSGEARDMAKANICLRTGERATDSGNPSEKTMDGFVEITEQMELPF